MWWDCLLGPSSIHAVHKKKKNPPAWELLCNSVLWFYSFSHTYLLSGAARVSAGSPSLPAP